MNGQEAIDALHEVLNTPKNGGKRKQSNAFPVIMTLLLLALIAVWLWMYRTDTSPPIRFDPARWNQTDEVCPGEVVTWTSTIHVNRAPVVGDSYVTIWSVDKKATVLAASQASTFIWTDRMASTKTKEYTVPKFPPGRYEYRTVVIANSNSKPAVQVIPFTIREDCDAKP